MIRHTLGAIANRLGCEVPPEFSGTWIEQLANLDDAKPGDIAFAANKAFWGKTASTLASAIVVTRDFAAPEGLRAPVLRVGDVNAAQASLLDMFDPYPFEARAGVHESAVVAASATVPASAWVGPGVVIGEGCRVGERSQFMANVVLGKGVVVGQDCLIQPGACIHDGCELGNRVLVGANSVIGGPGFGFRHDGKAFRRYRHIGRVVIEDDVELDAAVCIDRGKFTDTRIGAGTKLDNLVHIAHNVKVGPSCVIAGQVGIAGSVTVGAGVMMGGQAGVRDHVAIGRGAQVAGQTGIVGDIPENVAVVGSPSRPIKDYAILEAYLTRLPALMTRLKALEKQLAQKS